MARVREKWQTASYNVMNIVLHTRQGVFYWLGKFCLIRDNCAAWNWLVVWLFSFLLVI